MSNLPTAKPKRTSYENFVAECPYCGQNNIFNRASDLNDFAPITGREVVCQLKSCLRHFWINGDSINCAHEMLVFDCYELIQQKHYMNCVLSLAQAYEVFFSLFFRVELLYKPFGRDACGTLEELNALAVELEKKMEVHTFGSLRALFLRHVATVTPPKTLSEAAQLIRALPDSRRMVKSPKVAILDAVGDPRLRTLLKQLSAVTINTLRNKVVHKGAYRPTGAEVAEALEQTRSILFPITRDLNLHEDINTYVR